jgi:hypothetical protein
VKELYEDLFENSVRFYLNIFSLSSSFGLCDLHATVAVTNCIYDLNIHRKGIWLVSKQCDIHNCNQPIVSGPNLKVELTSYGLKAPST